MARIDSRQTRNFLVPLLWTLVIGIELFLLLNDITLFHAPKSELPEITGERIAALHDAIGGVRWQNPKDVIWSESREGQPLYDGQSLMTLTESSARLVFDARDEKSTEIEIGPKTLLQVQAKKNGGDRPLLLSLSRGTLRARTSRALELAAGEFTVHVDPGSRFEAESVDAGRSRSGRAALRLKVQEGGARSGNSVASRDQTIEVPILGEKESEGSASIAPVIFESESVAPSPTPSPTASPEPSPTPSTVASPKPPRVRALPPPNLQAPILRRRSPRPSGTPKAGASFFDLLFPSAVAAEPEPEEWEIELRWDAVPSAREYRVEIARTRKFETKIAEETTTEPHWAWPYRRGMENSKGRIFYRIATINEHGKVGKFSEPKIFVIPTEIAHPAPAVVVKPEPQATKTVAEIAPPRPPSLVAWSVRPAAELTSLTETSDFSQLRKVDTGGAYVHESLGFSRTSPSFIASGTFRANHFKADPSVLPKTRSYRVSLAGERPTSWLGGKMFFGAALFFEDHFEKNGADSLKLARGISLGPSATLANPLWSLSLRLPLTGAFGKGILAGPFGPTAHAEKDWDVASFGEGSDRTLLRASVSAEGSYHLWNSNRTATVTEWSIGLGPKIILR